MVISSWCFILVIQLKQAWLAQINNLHVSSPVENMLSQAYGLRLDVCGKSWYRIEWYIWGTTLYVFQKGRNFQWEKKETTFKYDHQHYHTKYHVHTFSLPDHIFCVMVSVGQGSIVKKNWHYYSILPLVIKWQPFGNTFFLVVSVLIYFETRIIESWLSFE